MKNQSLPARPLFALALLMAMVFVGCSKGPPKHGTRLTVAPINSATAAVDQQALVRAAKTLRQRFDDLAIRRVVVELSAEGHLVVSLPELPPERLASCRRAIENAGLLEFRMVHPESDKLTAASIPEPGYEVMKLEQIVMKNGREEKFTSRLLVNKKSELTGEHITRADVVRDRFSNTPKIAFELDKEGGGRLEQVTTEWRPKDGREYRLAIVLDGELRSAPAIKGVISRYGEISGNFSIKEASELAATLENPLDVPLRIVDETTF
jgi:SecD/SecF fusion protein